MEESWAFGVFLCGLPVTLSLPSASCSGTFLLTALSELGLLIPDTLTSANYRRPPKPIAPTQHHGIFDLRGSLVTQIWPVSFTSEEMKVQEGGITPLDSLLSWWPVLLTPSWCGSFHHSGMPSEGGQIEGLMFMKLIVHKRVSFLGTLTNQQRVQCPNRWLFNSGICGNMRGRQ